MSMFNIGLSALQVAQRVEDMLSHNIANMNTPGYKKLENHNFEVFYPNQAGGSVQSYQLGGVGTNIYRTSNPFADFRINAAMGDAAEAAAFNDGLKQLGAAIITKPVEEAFSTFMNSSQDLMVNPQDPVRQAAFKEAGQTFSTALQDLGNKFDEVTRQITYVRDMTQIELDNLQEAMSHITSGPATEEAMADLDNLAKQALMKSRSIQGYNKVLSGVIPPIYSMYARARDEVVDGSNTSYGQSLIDINGGFFDAANVGDVKTLTEFGSQKFNKDMGVINTTVGAKLNASDLLDGSAQGILDAAQAAYDAAYGVDLAEQATKMLQYQRMYEAATAIIKTQDEMLGTLLNIMA